MSDSPPPSPPASAAPAPRPEGRSVRRRGTLLVPLLAALALVLLPGRASSQQVAAVDTPARSAGIEEARGPADRMLEAVRAPIPRPDVDGDLGDEAWGAAPVATNFVQFEPEHGTEPSQRTEVRVLYTSDAVYVGARMYDTNPDEIIARLSRRDDLPTTDKFTVGIDSYDDNRTAFLFIVSAAGVQSDALVFDDTNEDPNWDAVWESAVEIDSAGWVAELRIPLSQLRFSVPEDTARGDTWGLNFQREIARLDETVQWSPLPEDRSRIVSAFGALTGLKRLSPPNNLEVRPYTVLKANHAPVDEANPFRGPTEMAGSFGGSLSYGITPNLTLNATANPDFGQVEADPSVVNLSAFETFFPEKRPFFQEGVDIFQLGIGPGDGNNEQLFYSRRIGRTPRGSAPSDAAYSKNPDATTILGAAKLSGKTSGGWSVGVLNALTAEEEARFLDPGQGISSVTTEPMTNYGVARVKKDFREGESSVGGIVTSTLRDVSPDGPMSFLPGGAFSGGVDARHRFGGGDWRVTAKLLGSHVTGNAGAIDRLQRGPNHYYQRPDADHLTYDPERTSLSGASASVEVMKLSGHWQGAVITQTRTPGFDVNDLGFQRGADQTFGAGSIGYRSLGPQGPFRNWNVNLNGYSGWTWGGERVGGGGNVNGSFQLRNYWRGYTGVNVTPAAHSTTELRGGPAIRGQPRMNGWAGLNTDSRKTVRFGLNANWGLELGTEGRRLSLGPSVTIQPTDAAEISLRPRMTWNRDVSQYVTTAADDGGTHYLFGHLEQRTASLTTRVNYTFSPDLSLQLYAQPFISAGDYSTFREVRDPRASEFGSRFRTYADGAVSEDGGTYSVDRDGDGEPEFEFGDPDFNIRQLRSNLVLRWEYMPGSRVFLVWSQDRSGFAPDGSFRLGRDLDALFGAEGRNVFQVKIEHWLGL